MSVKNKLLPSVLLSGALVFFVIMAVQKTLDLVAILFIFVTIAAAVSLIHNKENYNKAEEEDHLQRVRLDQERRSLGGVPYLLM